MADEQKEQSSEQVEESNQTQTEETQQETQTEESQQSETANTEQSQTEETKERTAESAEQQIEQQQAKTYKLKYKGEEVEKSEEELLELARKGFDYTKKMQAFSEMEKAQQATQAQQAMLQNNPDAVRLLLAKQAGIDPKYLFTDFPEPDPRMQEIDPQAYVNQLTDYQLAVKAKKALGDMVGVIAQNNAIQANNAIVNRAKLKYVEDGELSEADFQKMIDWTRQYVHPNQDGVYPSDSLDVAHKYLFGDKQMENEKLKQSNNIQKKLQEAVKNKNTSVSQRSQKPAAKSGESKFLEFVQGSDKAQSYYD